MSDWLLYTIKAVFSVLAGGVFAYATVWAVREALPSRRGRE